MKRRKKNIYFGFGPAKKSERLTVYRRPKYASRSHRGTSRGSSDSSLRSEVAEALVGQGYKRADARKMVARASGSDFNSLFRSAMQKNPRVLPEMTDEQLAAIRKLIRGKTIMAKKRKSKKKRNGKMPAGLKAYWARKRRAKAKRRNPKRPSRPGRKIWHSGAQRKSEETQTVVAQNNGKDRLGEIGGRMDASDGPTTKSPQAQESAATQIESYPQSQANHAEGFHGLADSNGCECGAASDRQARASRQTLAQPFMLEIRGPDGDILVFTSLYDFLRRMYVQEWTADEFRFEELQIEVNGAPLLPKSQGNA